MEQNRTFLRMPLGYGPMPGPRQTVKGVAHDGWDQSSVRTATITFQAPKNQLSSFLPHPCFHIDNGSADDDLATASFTFTELHNLPWLAGRGYNLSGLYIHDVVCRGADETVGGKYLSVLFENRADPIVSGREELGYAKVFASLDAVQDAGDGVDTFAARIGWEGAVFGDIKLTGLSDVPPRIHANAETAAAATAGWPSSSSSSSSVPQGVLHYKYIPRTGCPGEADVEYPTFCAAPPQSQPTSVGDKVLVAKHASLSFRALGFADLPTLHHIAAKLADIDIRAIVDARIVESRGATDLRDQRAIRLG
ncbi:Acetoacetate decarboxylase beta barrel domain protein [Niveomyces insectorum RCEF 264]|uniref:Acetoacetate decarboxylase beta barrel domain protein n=1 Tax=Niveomyces insectorum RCEF 264 TaxID=1081102 RepID=A0A167LXF2_9HYPO|nr:Acetoacetate decarboxylase beta barrel domain protein [Niveomyces insectorum RCEF 264]